MTPIKHIDHSLLGSLVAEAAAHPRLRVTHRIHDSSSDGVQRLLTALQPGTYVRPHRHAGAGFELLVLLRGALGLITFDEQARILAVERMREGGALVGLELPAFIFHTVVALAPDTVILEIKPGPYDPGSDKDFSTSFPLEGSAEAGEAISQWRALFEGPGVLI